MPVREIKIRRNNKIITCYTWGRRGKIYCGRSGRLKALRQGRAIHARHGR